MINATLVTIHGFWSSPATWERLNAIWYADEQLRGLRIHPFGYPSPKKPQLPFATTRVPDYEDIAQTLATEYTVRLAEAPDIAFVTHSQGGLILQRFLTWMLDQDRGRELAWIRTIVMLACPNDGSEYLRSVRHVLGFSRHAQAGNLEVLDRQVADTQRTVLQRIVNATGVDDHQCRIPFHVYAGDSDKIVPAASGQGPFPEPPSWQATISPSSTPTLRATAQPIPSNTTSSPIWRPVRHSRRWLGGTLPNPVPQRSRNRARISTLRPFLASVIPCSIAIPCLIVNHWIPAILPR